MEQNKTTLTDRLVGVSSYIHEQMLNDARLIDSQARDRLMATWAADGSIQMEDLKEALLDIGIGFARIALILASTLVAVMVFALSLGKYLLKELDKDANP